MKTILILSRGIPELSNNPQLGVFEYDQAKSIANNCKGVNVFLVGFDLRSIRRRRKIGIVKAQMGRVNAINISFPLGRVPNCILKTVGWFFFKRIIKRILKKQNIDLIHAHFGLFQGYFAYRAFKKFNIKYAVTEHSSDVNQDYISKNNKKLLSTIYSNASLRIAVSKSFCEKLLSLYKTKFEYIPNVLDSSSFNEKTHQPDESFFTFVSVGNLVKSKRFDYLINCFKHLKNEQKKSRLVIVGCGPEEKELKKMANENIIFVGQKSREEIDLIIERSNCFVLLSEHETFGVAYIEAMYKGLPVIATKCGGPESFVHPFNGFLFDIDNEKDIIDTMNNFVNNVYFFNSKKIQQFVKKSFAPSVICDKLISEYNKVW